MPSKNLRASLLATLVEAQKAFAVWLPSKLPAKPGPAADLLYQTRERRLLLQKVVEELETQETALKEFFRTTLPKQQQLSAGGTLAQVELKGRAIPQVKDWDKFTAHILKTKDISLLQRRVNDSYIQELWADKKTVPGVESFTVISVSCTKL